MMRGMTKFVIVAVVITLAQSADFNIWCQHENSFLYSYAGPSFTSLDEAKSACLANDECNGVTQVS